MRPCHLTALLMATLGLVIAVPLTADDPAPAGLSPAEWGDAERQRVLELNATFGGQNTLAAGKSAVIAGTTGAPAVRAGLEALRQGGTAADAVLTTSLTQISLAKGAWVSYAGILTMVYYDAETGKIHNLNAGYNTVLGEDDPKSIPKEKSGRTALVPGYMAGVEAAHAKFGKLPFASLFEPAIYYAETGFPLTSLNAGMINSRKDVLSRFPDVKRMFTKDDGTFYAAGDLFKQPEVATTLRKVAESGAGYMYTGEWAERFVEAVRRDGGKMSMEDMKGYEAIWSEPLKIHYAGHDIYAHGLPAQGGVHLAEALHVAAAADLAGMGHYSESPEAFFWASQIGNVFALSFLPPETRELILGGKDTSLEHRATEGHGDRVWGMMKEGKFMLTRKPNTDGPGHSDAVVVVDQWGNVAAIVHTINTATWGQTGLFVDGVSIPDSASFQQQLIAETGPGKRLPDPTEPLIILKDGKPVAALSSIGSGLHQKTLAVLWNLLDFEKGIKPAVDAPSFHLPKFSPLGVATPQVFAEDFSEELLKGVKDMGLDVEVVPNDLTSRAPRGYVVGLSIDPETGRRSAVSTATLNAPAMGD